MDSLREFIGSSSGLAPARQGLGLGWVISALTGVAILLGAREAAADEDYCFEQEWTDFLGYSSGCDKATKGKKPGKCQDCSLNIECEESCDPPYCCA